jgi:ATP:corrinoid adenosyltransferase
MDNAFKQLELASKESKKRRGGVVRVHTGQGKGARAFLIQEIVI